MEEYLHMLVNHWYWWVLCSLSFLTFSRWGNFIQSWSVSIKIFFNGAIFLRSLSPQSTDLSGSMEVYLGDGVFGSERTLVRGRTILSAKRGASDDSFIASGENFEGATGNDSFNASFIPGFPYWQCLAYINKTHSQRYDTPCSSLCFLLEKSSPSR